MRGICMVFFFTLIRSESHIIIIVFEYSTVKEKKTQLKYTLSLKN